MYVPSQISPSVKLILPSFLPYELSLTFSQIEIFDQIFVIDTNVDFQSAFEKQFEKYKEKGHVYDVDVTGLKTDNGVGSQRFCTMDYKFAKNLTSLFTENNILDGFLEKSSKKYFEFSSVSQYFRFMKYVPGGQHFPHYDSDFQYDNPEYVTKYSLVMYFTDCESGEIYFCNDPNEQRGDWTRQATDEEIYLKVLPRKGRIVIFPHDLCHGVLPLKEGNRMMIRSDLIFKETKC